MASDQEDPSDRRRAARIPINAEFAAMPSATYISDLSEYGVFLHTPNPSPRGTKLKLRFSVLLDDPVIVEAEGRVVRQQFAPTPGMGVEFTELGPEMILRINDVLSRQRPRDSGPPLAPESDEESTETDTLEVARTLDTGQTLRRAPGASGTFRPPAMPGRSDDDAKTGLYQPVEGSAEDDLDDWESE